MSAALLAGMASPAAASTPQGATQQLQSATGFAPTATNPSKWVPGSFEISGAPILSNPPDGWLCHVGLDCRPGVLAEAGLDDEDRLLDLTTVGSAVTVQCHTGAFGAGHWALISFKGTVGPHYSRRGWVAIDAVDTTASGRATEQCTVGDWAYD